MSDQYIYSIEDDFPNQEIDTTSLTSEINESNITVALDYINTDNDHCYIWFKDTLSSGFVDILNGIVGNHSGESSGTGLPYLSDVNDKLVVHSTVRKPGLKFVWSGAGDNVGNSTYVWGGQNMRYHHQIGDPVFSTMYVDFNAIENETYIQEGYMFWDGCKLDVFTAHIVPRVTSTTSGVSTSYTLYGGYMIVPTASGTGDIEITSDITQLHGGLVYMPKNEFDERPQAFWNADWNSTNQMFENITAAPSGDGLYNLFATEICLQTFINEFPLISEGQFHIESHDADKLGQGMRIKINRLTNTSSGIGDHEWMMGCVMVMHRANTCATPGIDSDNI